jgi:hypothetical protein
VNVSNFITSPIITVANAGVYKVLTSVQFNKTGLGANPTAAVMMWIAVNSLNVPNSATKLVLNNNLESVMTVEWFVVLGAGDGVAIYADNPDSNGDLEALAIPITLPSAAPNTPSIITTILRIA